MAEREELKSAPGFEPEPAQSAETIAAGDNPSRSAIALRTFPAAVLVEASIRDKIQVVLPAWRRPAYPHHARAADLNS